MDRSARDEAARIARRLLEQTRRGELWLRREHLERLEELANTAAGPDARRERPAA
jgi:hypothetical protein